ncbi:metallophosphoesterase family protein [archaeon]|nr:metallophosphoesterase family protein [archaeon]
MKEEIVQKYLSQGKLLTPSALDALSKGQYESLAQENLIVEESSKTQERIRILKNLNSVKKEISSEDFINFFRSKYENIKDILITRLQKPFVSINKLNSYRDEVYITCIIRSIKEVDNKKILDVEDMTGSLSVIFEENVAVDVGDVVAIKGASSKNVLFGKQIIYPDVPLRQPKTGIGKACFISGLMIHETPSSDVKKFFSWFEIQGIKYLIVAGDVGDLEEFENLVAEHCNNAQVIFIPGESDMKTEYPRVPVKFKNDNIISLSDPSMVEINGLNILLIHEFSVDMLKKRYLGSSKAILDDDYFVLDHVPDIVCFGHGDEPQITNYKSVTIVASGSLLAGFRPIIIDFETREAIKASTNNQ